jgi:hydroxymethylglutaryl-CoA lyase
VLDLAALRGRNVTIVEVGPRDGLQNERAIVPTAAKIGFIDRLSAAGLPVIEVTSFVRPDRIPQLADAADVCRGITRRESVRYSALVPNLHGLERAQEAGIGEVAVFAAASETFSRRNINQSIEGSLGVYRQVCERARRAGMRVRGYLSTSFGCPYEGPVPVGRVVELTDQLLSLGVFEVAVSDTIGVAHPAQVQEVLHALLTRVAVDRLALHFHDTRGTALANVLTGLSMGITTFDASAGGLGGCPYAPGAAGNLATDDLIYMLDGLGVRTGVDLAELSSASLFIGRGLDHPLPSRYAQAAAARTSDG